MKTYEYKTIELELGINWFEIHTIGCNFKVLTPRFKAKGKSQ